MFDNTPLSPEEARKSRMVTIAFWVILISSLGWGWTKFVILKWFPVEMSLPCDPAVEICFLWECDPLSPDPAEQCTGDIEQDVWYYGATQREASKVFAVDCDWKTDESCDPMACEEGEKNCGVVICNEREARIREIACSYPETYTPPVITESIEDEAAESEEDQSAETVEGEEYDAYQQELTETEEEPASDTTPDVELPVVDEVVADVPSDSLPLDQVVQ